MQCRKSLDIRANLFSGYETDVESRLSKFNEVLNLLLGLDFKSEPLDSICDVRGNLDKGSSSFVDSNQD